MTQGSSRSCSPAAERGALRGENREGQVTIHRANEPIDQLRAAGLALEAGLKLGIPLGAGSLEIAGELASGR
jgi:hypothetical protein